jgi:heme-degrading monooxygenase HmoA
MHIIIWEYEPTPGREADFEAAYGPTGTWTQLFRQGSGYLGSEFYRHAAKPGRYATIDRWESAAHYEQFRQQHAIEYELMDRRYEQLTVEECCTGSYDTVE